MDTTLKFYELHPDLPIRGLQITPRGQAYMRAMIQARDTVLLRDAAGQWGTRCPHGHTEMWRTRGAADVAKRNPHNWCDQCLAIVGENLDVD